MPISISADASSNSDIGVDNINTIAIENKLFDANMPNSIESTGMPSSSSIPMDIIANQPNLETTQPIEEQIMKQLPIPNDLVNALSKDVTNTNVKVDNVGNTVFAPTISDQFGLQNQLQETNSRTQNTFNNNIGSHSDQRFSRNNVRDGLILDTLPTGLQDIPISFPENTNQMGFDTIQTVNARTDPLSAPSLDKLSSNIPIDILSPPQSVFDSNFDSVVDFTMNSSNNDPTIMKIANILPESNSRKNGRHLTSSKVPGMTMEAEGFTTKGRFNTIQRGFNRTTRLSSKNGINVQMQITPHFESKSESSHKHKKKQDSQTAHIQTDGSFLGSASPVPKMGAGQGLPHLGSTDQVFYDQATLLGSLSDAIPQSFNQQIPVDVPLPPPQSDVLIIPNTAKDDSKIDTNFLTGEVSSGVVLPDMLQSPAISFTSTIDAPVTTFMDPNTAQPTATSNNGMQPEFVSIENNPNWAVFDPSTLATDLNFAEINPVINGISDPVSDIAFVSTNDIKFTNAFDVAPVNYESLPSTPTSATPKVKAIEQNVLTESTASPTAAAKANNISTGNTLKKSNKNTPTNDIALLEAGLNKLPTGTMFEEVVIAPLATMANHNKQTPVNLPPPPPI